MRLPREVEAILRRGLRLYGDLYPNALAVKQAGMEELADWLLEHGFGGERAGYVALSLLMSEAAAGGEL